MQRAQARSDQGCFDQSTLALTQVTELLAYSQHATHSASRSVTGSRPLHTCMALALGPGPGEDLLLSTTQRRVGLQVPSQPIGQPVPESDRQLCTCRVDYCARSWSHTTVVRKSNSCASLAGNFEGARDRRTISRGPGTLSETVPAESIGSVFAGWTALGQGVRTLAGRGEEENSERACLCASETVERVLQ